MTTVNVEYGGNVVQVQVGENTQAALNAATAATTQADRAEAAADDAAGTAASIADRVPENTPADASYVPAIVLGKTAALWFTNGLLDAKPSAQFREAILDGRIGSLDPLTDNYVPIVLSGKTVPVWIEGGALAFGSLAARSIAYLQGALGITPPTPIATDGTTMRLYRADAGRARSNTANSVLRVGMVGDSWCDLTTIPAQLVALLDAKYTRSSEGFVPVASSSQISGVTRTVANWTTADMTPASGRTLGPDGRALWSSGTNATMAIGGLTGSQITIGYWNGNGTFRYNVNGGSWVTVAGTGANARATLTITGLGTGPNTLNIDTTGNTGTVEIYFVISERPTETGATMFKMGKGGSFGLQWSAIESHIAGWSATLALDLLIIILGTNDMRAAVSTATPANYAAGIGSLVAAHKSANPALSVLFIAPPMHGDDATGKDIDAYRAAAVAKCQELGIEHYLAWREWDDHTTENARGQWADLNHLSAAGASRLLADLDRRIGV